MMTSRFAPLLVALALLAGCEHPASPPTDAGTLSPLDAASPSDTDAAPLADAGPGPGSDAGPAVDAPSTGPCTPAGECDPFSPTSCTDGKVCRPDTSGGPTSCVAAGTTLIAAGEACAAGDQCAAGTACVDFGDGLHCERLCARGSTGACGAGYACIGTVTGYDPCIQVCRPLPRECDALANDCAAPDETCAFATNPETGAHYTGCRAAGTQADGQPCGGDAGGCARGLVCVTEDGASACHHPCDASVTPTTCPASQLCNGTLTGFTFGYCRAT